MADRNDGIGIRAAVLADLPALVEIYNHYVLHSHCTFDLSPFKPEQRVAWFHDHSDGKRHQMLVACDPSGKVVGYAGTGPHRAKETVEASVYGHPDFARRGVGTLLYRSLFEALEGQDIHRIVAGIAQPNEGSNALHRRMGFKVIGVYSEVGRKFGKYWDVLWMERPLNVPDSQV